MRSKHLLLMLLLALMAPWVANAQTLTVYDEGTTTNRYVPIDGYNVDGTSIKSEYIMPASELTAMNGKEITKMTLYLSTVGNRSWGDATFRVFMKEVEATTISSFTGYADATVVYLGALDCTQSEMEISFTENYIYNGGNLLIGFYIVTSGSYTGGYNDYKPLYTGEEVTGASIGGTYATQRNFLPKTTFTYQAPSTCFKPQNLTATLTPGNGTIATLNWERHPNGAEDAWVLQYGTDEEFGTGTYTQVNVTGGTPTKDLTGLTAEQTYYARVKPDCDIDGSKWSATCEFTPTNALTKTINDGTKTNNRVPVYAYWADATQRSEFIIPASSLSSLNGSILKSMKFYANFNYTSTKSFQVYLKEVTEDVFSGTTFYTAEGATTVYNNTITVSSTDGMTITFSEGFEYNGGNLLVGFYQATSGNAGSSSNSFYGIEATGSSLSAYSSNSAAQQNFLPKVTFSYLTNPFPKPKNLAVSNITNESATATWEAPATGAPTGYNYQYKPEGGEWTALTTTTNLSAPLTSLTGNTTYEFQVQAIYAGNNESAFASKTFTTLCNVFPIPYSFGFETAEIADLNCWTIIDEYGRTAIDDGTDLTSASAHTGNNFFAFTYYDYPDTDPQYMTLISPELTGMVSGLHVEFYYLTDGQSSYPETFRVGYSTTNTDLSSFTWSNTITDAVAADYQLFKANYPAGTKFVAVQHLSDDMDYLILDDFSFTEAPSCVEPTNLQVSNITTSGAALSWTIGGDATSWDIYVTDDETDVPADATAPTYAGVTLNTNYPISGLTSGTTYYVYVRSACDATTNSDWTMPTSFNTACEAISLPYQYDFEDDALPICWNTIGTNSGWITSYISNTAPQHGSKHFVIQNSNYETGTQYVVLPEVDANYPVNEYEITFYSELAGNSTTGRTLAVGVMTDQNDASTFVQIGDAFTPSTTYEQYKVRLNTYTGSGHYIAIKHVITSGSYYASLTYIDNLEVSLLPACLEPSDPVVSNITNHTAKLDWTGTSAGYNIDYRTAEYNDASMLDEDFTGLTSGIPTGWNNDEGTTTTASYKWSYNNSGHDAAPCVRFDSYSNSNGYTNFLKTPSMNFPAGKTMQLSFWWKNPTGGDFSVYISTDGGDTKTLLKGDMTSQSTWKQETITLPNDYVGASNVTIHFKGTSNYGNGDAYIYLDDITLGVKVAEGAWQHTTSTTNTKTIEGLLAETKYDVRVQGDCGSEGTSEWSDIVSFTTDIKCPAPSGLAYANLKSDHVDLSWTNGGSADWIVAYKADGETEFIEKPVATADVDIEGNTVTYTLTGLNEKTAYTVKVQDNCEASYAGDGLSQWTSEITFTTLEECAKPTDVTISNIGHYSADVTWTGDSDSFNVFVGHDEVAQTYLSEDFEEQSIPDDWTNESTKPWTVVEGNGGHCMKSGNAGVANSISEISFTYKLTEPAKIEFDALCMGEGTGTYWDHCDFYIDDTRKLYAGANISGWNHYSFDVEAGNHTFKWSYTKDNTTDPTGDYFAVDNISLIKINRVWNDPINVTVTECTITVPNAGAEYFVKVAPSCNAALVSEVVNFTTVSPNVKYFMTEGNWDNENNWEPTGVPTIEQDVVLKANATIESGVAYAKSIAGTGTGDNAKTLTIESGAKLKHLNSGVRATVKKTITGYGAGHENDKADYYLIANPLSYTTITTTSTPAISTTGLLTGNYDFYNWVYSASDGNEWRNYEKNAFNFDYGLYGYLYANEATTTLAFTGTINPYTGYWSRNLSASSSTTQDFPGWYLLGNPYMYDAYLANGSSSTATGLPYVKMNAAGDGFENVPAGTPIEPMTGFFYQATTSGSVYVVTTAPTVTDAGLLNMNLRSGNKQLDNAIVAFGSEQKLEKFSFRANSSKIYMPVEGKDYAITNAEPQGEMPVSFKAEKNGSYTLSFSNEEVTFSYLHLIDNMTGEDVNLLETPSYSFEAKTTDYASRFKLVFSTGNGVNEESFAFISDGNIILNGEGMLQVVDVMGRIMMQEENATSVSTSGMTPGVYVLRLINGDSVKTQKIVIK